MGLSKKVTYLDSWGDVIATRQKAADKIESEKKENHVT